MQSIGTLGHEVLHELLVFVESSVLQAAKLALLRYRSGRLTPRWLLYRSCASSWVGRALLGAAVGASCVGLLDGWLLGVVFLSTSGGSVGCE